MLKKKYHHFEGLVALTAGRYVPYAECYTWLTLLVSTSPKKETFVNRNVSKGQGNMAFMDSELSCQHTQEAYRKEDHLG